MARLDGLLPNMDSNRWGNDGFGRMPSVLRQELQFGGCSTDNLRYPLKDWSNSGGTTLIAYRISEHEQ
jgi:hypothetical protein